MSKVKDSYLQALLAVCAWREARGEGLQGMRAVMHVIRNRVQAWKQDWDEVISRRNQFTSMSVKGDGQLTVWPDDDDALFEQVLDLAVDIYHGMDNDITEGALYYENPQVATSQWFIDRIRNNPMEHPTTAIIGRHTFYK